MFGHKLLQSFAVDPVWHMRRTGDVQNTRCPVRVRGAFQPQKATGPRFEGAAATEQSHRAQRPDHTPQEFGGRRLSALRKISGGTVCFDGLMAIRNLSFQIGPAELRAEIRPNKAGRTASASGEVSVGRGQRWARSASGGQDNLEATALPRRAGRRDRAACPADQGAADGEAETGAFGTFCCVKRVENP